MLLKRKRHFSDKGLQTYMTLEEKKIYVINSSRPQNLLISNTLKSLKKTLDHFITMTHID